MGGLLARISDMQKTETNRVGYVGMDSKTRGYNPHEFQAQNFNLVVGCHGPKVSEGGVYLYEAALYRHS